MTESNPWVAASTRTGSAAIADRVVTQDRCADTDDDLRVSCGQVSVSDQDVPNSVKPVTESAVTAWETAARAYVSPRPPTDAVAEGSEAHLAGSSSADKTVSAQKATDLPDGVGVSLSSAAPTVASTSTLQQVRSTTDAKAAVASELVAPQPGVVSPPDGLPVQLTGARASLWLVGAHGGAGESTLAMLGPGWAAAEHAWPELSGDGVAPCVVVARTHVRGLLAARTALTQWAGSGVGRSVRLLGVVLVADAPGRLPGSLRDLSRLVAGGAPRVWNVPWVEQWRIGETDLDGCPRTVKKLVSELCSLAEPTMVGTETSHSSKEKPGYG